jgi:hypothetical protein
LISPHIVGAAGVGGPFLGIASENECPRAGSRIASPLRRGVRARGGGVTWITHYFPAIVGCAADLCPRLCNSDDRGGPASLRAVILAAHPCEATRQIAPVREQLARWCRCSASFPHTTYTNTRTIPVLNSEVIEFQVLRGLTLVAGQLCSMRSWRPLRWNFADHRVLR